MVHLGCLCPRTGQTIPITAEAAKASAEQTLESRFTFECSACGGHHVWSHRWATLGRTNHRIAKCTPRNCGPVAMRG
jgi:hypothetical protein